MCVLRSIILCRCWASPAPSDSGNIVGSTLTRSVCASAVSRPDSRSAPYAEQAENIPVTRMQHEYVPQRQQKEVQGKVSAPPPLVLSLLQRSLRHAQFVLLLCHGAALKCAPAPLCCGRLPLGASTLKTGLALQVGQNSQFSEGFDPSVYAAARADLQARKAAKAKAHTGAGGRTTHPAVRACVCQCWGSAHM